MDKNWLDKKVVPERYVYHVTTSDKRDSILENGLLAKACIDSKWSFFDWEDQQPPMVFANNTEFVGDFFYWDKSSKTFNYQKWDFWRIDTEKYKGDWYFDLNTSDPGRAGIHICTPNNIQVNALALLQITDCICNMCGGLNCGGTALKFLDIGITGSLKQTVPLIYCPNSQFNKVDIKAAFLHIEEQLERHGRYRI